MRKVFLKKIPSHLLSFHWDFVSDIENISTISRLLALLICEHSALCYSFQQVMTMITLFLTVPVTVASSESTSSKLKLIKTEKCNGAVTIE
jgi:hypothetical protein